VEVALLADPVGLGQPGAQLAVDLLRGARPEDAGSLSINRPGGLPPD
jgi:hypothetical protein